MGLHGLLADEMGLGKTVQVLAFLSSLPPSSVLIVAPTSLLFNWKKEIEKFLPGREVHVHTGTERLREKEELAEKEILLTSYALLRRDALLLQKIPFDLIVLDEAQTIKNPDSQIAVCARELQGKMRICLSGTPVENRPDDLWSLFAFLLPGLLGERKSFALVSGMAKRVEKKIAPFLLRRTKEVIADQLPPLLEQVVWVEMNDAQRQCYEELLEARKIALFDKDKVARKLEILEAILRLRKFAPTQFSSKRSGKSGGAASGRGCSPISKRLSQAERKCSSIVGLSRCSLLSERRLPRERFRLPISMGRRAIGKRQCALFERRRESWSFSSA